MLPSDENGDGIITHKQIFRTDRLGRERRDKRRIDAARKAEQNFSETVLASVVANAENKRLSDRFAFGAGDAACVGFADIELDRLDKLLERRRLQDNVAFFVGDQARTVKDDAVVAADKIYENDRHSFAALHRCATMSQRSLILPLLYGEALIETMTSAPISITSSVGSFSYRRSFQNVLSFQKSSQTTTPSLTPLISNRRRRVARLEITRVVEHVVFGQQGLVGKSEQFAVVNNGGAVVQPPAVVVLVRPDRADNRRNALRRRNDLFKRFERVRR